MLTLQFDSFFAKIITSCHTFHLQPHKKSPYSRDFLSNMDSTPKSDFLCYRLAGSSLSFILLEPFTSTQHPCKG